MWRGTFLAKDSGFFPTYKLNGDKEQIFAFIFYEIGKSFRSNFCSLLLVEMFINRLGALMDPGKA